MFDVSKFDPQKHTLYDVSWQGIRIFIKGKWGSKTGVAQNIAFLRFYIGDCTKVSTLWRVLNLLNATRMGYSGTRLEGSEQDKLVTAFRDEVQGAYHLLARGDNVIYELPTEEQIRREWPQLPEPTRKRIYEDLAKRKKLHKESKYREELGWFLSIINSYY